MCLGIPGRVVQFVDEARQLAKVDVSNVRRTVHVGLLLPEGLETGDWVLIHVGFAISKIDEEEAKRTIAFLEELGDAYEQEMEQFFESKIE
ncbi:MAG: HypC/HybG/HupF family hydrogenase formation chaperone [Acidobacteria bacterium]|nr:HypC/HybG/HupF family hydrogenase formation chaperone [Acidobacteriota bacterium]